MAAVGSRSNMGGPPRAPASSEHSWVELRGLEPLTPTLPVWCATSCATAPRARCPGHSRNSTHAHRRRHLRTKIPRQPGMPHVLVPRVDSQVRHVFRHIVQQVPDIVK